MQTGGKLKPAGRCTKWFKVSFIIGKVDTCNFVRTMNLLTSTCIYLQNPYPFFIPLKFDFKYDNDVKMGATCTVSVSSGHEGACQ